MAQLVGKQIERGKPVARRLDVRRPLMLIVMAASIPILLFAGWTTYRDAEEQRRAARAAAGQVVDRVVERVTAELTAQIRVVETLALSAALDTPDLPTFYREADRLKTAHPLWYTVELDDLSGRQVMNLLRPLGSELGPTADRDSFDRVVSERRPVVGGIGPVGPVSQRRLVTLRAPVMRGGMLQSVLTIAFAPDAISSILRDAGVPEGWVAAIVDGRGNVIARTLAEDATVGQPASADLRREIGRAESGVYPGRTLEGLDCEVNFRTLSAELGRWSIHLGVPLQSLNQPFYRAFVAVAGGILASLALAGILAALVAEDVRRRRALELGLADEALNESERRGALAVEAAELGTFQWDLREERVSSSERCRELLNVPPSAGTLLEWPSETFFAAVPAEDRETVVAAARRASRTGGEFTTEFRALCEDGSLRWLRGRGRRAMLGGTNVLTGVVADMTAQKRAELERLRLLRRLSDAQEEVQSRIARELHDQVGQTVTGLSLGLKTLERALGDRDISSSKATAADRADDPISTVLWLQGLTAEIGRDIHRAAADLRPTALDDLGLPGALRTLAADWSARTGIRVEVQLIGEAGRFSTQVETATYRIVQEALTNVVKHAAAATVSVVLERRGSELRILIEDDGLGFDCDDVPALDRGRPRLGLVGIRERLLHLGGALQVEATPGAGTTLFVTIPLSDADLSRGQA